VYSLSQCECRTSWFYWYHWYQWRQGRHAVRRCSQCGLKKLL